MSDNKEKVMVSVWCRGPGVPWSSLTKLERLAVLFRNEPDDSQPSVLQSLTLDFTECGLQLVELDISNPDDIYPYECPVCKTDTNWDIKGFFKTYPQYESKVEE